LLPKSNEYAVKEFVFGTEAKINYGLSFIEILILYEVTTAPLFEAPSYQVIPSEEADL
jgi:hypothetical protein